MMSGRRYSVKRHIDKIHAGSGSAVPLSEYLVGRLGGQYLAPVDPNLSNAIAFTRALDSHSKEENDSDLITPQKLKEQVVRVIVERMVEANLPPAGDIFYKQFKGIIQNAIKEIQRKAESEL